VRERERETMIYGSNPFFNIIFCLPFNNKSHDNNFKRGIFE
jgi:hypothetical protein